MSESIKVVVRIRPMNNKQKSLNCQQIVKTDEQQNQIIIVKLQQPQNIKQFAYDSVFNAESIQSDVYAKTAYGLVQNVLQGYNGTIFAYGQTGCGKTHSMVGKLQSQELQGIIPRSFGHILNSISQAKNKEFLIRCSFIQIYNQEVRDLLGKQVKKSLQIKQSPDKGVFIKDLSSNPAKTHEQLMQYMNLGNKNRSVGQTAMNKDSSRSHLLFMLYLQSADMSIPEQNRKYIGSKLNLVDLAGSQRINKTGAQGDRLQQAKNINLSLSALGNVISALVDGKSQHIPYRDSKLTRLLQDSLGGNTKTVMIANCSPADYNFDETLSTLRYASRAKFIKNKPIINQDPKDALLKQYTNQIKKLKQILANQSGSINVNGGDFGTQGSIDQHYDVKMKEKQRQIANQKEQTKMLQERLKALEKQHLFSENVKIDNKIKQKIRQVRQSALNLVSVSQNIPQQSLNTIKFALSPNPHPYLSSFPSQPHQNQSLSPSLFSSSSPQQHSSSSCYNMKQLIKSLKSQIKSAQNQLKDIQHQNYLDKQLVLNDIRQLSKQNKLLQGIVKILLSPVELERVKGKIQAKEKQNNIGNNNNGQIGQGMVIYGYNQDKNVYKIPNFYLKQKQIIFPKINIQDKSMELLKNYSNVSRNSRCSNSDDGQKYLAKKQEIINRGGDKDKVIRNNSKLFNNNQLLNPNNGNKEQKLKNNSSFIFGKGGKQNKKDLNTVRCVILQARQVPQSQGSNSILPSPAVKKNLPTHLQPLNKPDLNQKLQKLQLEKEGKVLEKCKKLQKLQKLTNYPVPTKLSMFGPIDQ